MRLLTSSLFFVFLLNSGLLSAQCPPGERHIRLEIDPDQYWYEVSWQLTNLDGNVVYTNGQLSGDHLYVFDYCIPEEDGCVIFKINDAAGDGIFPDGYYKVFVNDSLIRYNLGGAYGNGESFRFGCPEGAYCDHALLINGPGVFTTPTAAETWYSFTPDTTGAYEINTCNMGNDCVPKIWVYNMCDGITLSENQTGATYYAYGGCNGGTVARFGLAGGHEYFFRLRYADPNCSDQPLSFTLSSAGQVVGCTDPAACNYDPLAVVSDTCYYDSDPNCPDKPDLAVRQDVLQTTMQLDFIANADACMVDEGCLRGLGARNIVRFTTQIENIGAQDYFIGETPASPNTPSDQFVWDPCHHHWHYRGYAEYVLYNSMGQSVPIGSKNGFCVLDLQCPSPDAAKYTCNNMGITAGCRDVYDANLPCQWIDITGMPAGDYIMVVRVNWDKSPDKAGRRESTYENNWAQVCFNLQYDNQNLPILEVKEDDCAPILDCNGIPFGDTQTDCNGICGGPALKGDLNGDTLRTVADVQGYLNAALAVQNTVTECNELYADNQINLFDAALLQECNLHHDSVAYWGVRFPCQFPTGVYNEKDIVYLLPGKVDTVAKTFDVRIVNPYNKVIGYEFSVSGLEIASVENLDPVFDGAALFNNNGKIIALSPTESPVKKNILPGDFLRIHYSKLTSNQICISEVYNIINAKYQKSAGLVANPNCVTIENQTSSVNDPLPTLGALVQPNPFASQTTIFFTNPNLSPARITVADMTGRIVRAYDHIREEEITISKGNLTPGMYLFTIQTEAGVISGKMSIQ